MIADDTEDTSCDQSTPLRLPAAWENCACIQRVSCKEHLGSSPRKRHVACASQPTCEALRPQMGQEFPQKLCHQCLANTAAWPSPPTTPSNVHGEAHASEIPRHTQTLSYAQINLHLQCQCATKLVSGGTLVPASPDGHRTFDEEGAPREFLATLDCR